MSTTPGPEPTYGGAEPSYGAAGPDAGGPNATRTGPARTDARPARDARAEPRPGKSEPNTTGWVSLLVALALLGLQIYYALNASVIDSGGQQGYRAVITFGSLILGLAGAVLALVGMAQRRTPRWPSLVGLSIGTYAFIIAVFSWIGGLMNSAGTGAG